MLPSDCLKEPSEKGLPKSVLVMAHIASKLVIAFSGFKVPQDERKSQLSKTMQALSGFGNRLEHVTGRKILEQMVERPDMDTGFFRGGGMQLPREVFHLLDALISWRTSNDELKLLASHENDLHFLTNKLSLYETLAAALTESIMNDEMFHPLKLTASDYCSQYLEQLTKTIDELGHSAVDELKKFEEKYGRVFASAEAWEMDGVAHLLEGDGSVAELKQASQSIINLANCCGRMSFIVGHGTVSEELDAVIVRMKLFSADAGKRISRCRSLGATCIVAGTLLNDPNTKQNIGDALALAMDYFNVGKDALPGKLKKLVVDGLGPAPKAKAGAKKRKGDEENTAADEEAKPKKEKQEKPSKEKADKSKQKEGKEKKEKQEKKRKRS